MNHLKYRFISIVLFYCLFASNVFIAQTCPDGSLITTNTKCLYVSWTTSPPANYMSNSISYNSESYTFLSGNGTASVPAIYKTGTGNCSGSTPNFTGTFLFNGATCSYSNGVLPVKWIEFNKNNNRLQWTVEERNVLHYDIEKGDGYENFQSLETISSKGDGLNKYDFILPEKNTSGYFRIKQIDIDGHSTYSPLIYDETTQEKEFKVFPNPSSNFIQIECPYDISISINDMNGRVIQNKELKNGSTTLDINLLNNGIYFLKTNNGIVRKITKL
jgi:hypothetical protein